MPEIKIILHDGVVVEVLGNGPVNVQILDICQNTEGYDGLIAREKELYADESLKPIDFDMLF